MTAITTDNTHEYLLEKAIPRTGQLCNGGAQGYLFFNALDLFMVYFATIGASRDGGYSKRKLGAGGCYLPVLGGSLDHGLKIHQPKPSRNCIPDYSYLLSFSCCF